MPWEGGDGGNQSGEDAAGYRQQGGEARQEEKKGNPGPSTPVPVSSKGGFRALAQPFPLPVGMGAPGSLGSAPAWPGPHIPGLLISR